MLLWPVSFVHFFFIFFLFLLCLNRPQRHHVFVFRAKLSHVCWTLVVKNKRKKVAALPEKQFFVIVVATYK